MNVRDRKGMRHLATAARSPRARVPRARPCRRRSGQPRPADNDAAAAHLAFGDAGADARRHKRSPPTGVVSPRSTTTSTSTCRRRPLREAQADAEREFLIRELSAPWASVAAVDEPGRHPSAPDPGSHGRSARRSPASKSTTPNSASTSNAPSAPAPTAPTSQTPAPPTVGNCDAAARLLDSGAGPRRVIRGRVDCAARVVPGFADGCTLEVPAPRDRRREPDVVAGTDDAGSVDRVIGRPVDADAARHERIERRKVVDHEARLGGDRQ